MIGLLAGAIIVLLLRGASFMWEFPNVTTWYFVAIISAPLLFGGIAWLLPISDMSVARLADSCGLHARAQTALMLKSSDTPMADLQRQDTLECLNGFNPKAMLPFQVPRFSVIGVLVCALCFSASFLIANPQMQIMHAKTEFQTEMKKQADLVEEGATKLDDAQAQTQDLRKLLGDLAHELRQSTEPKTALSALDDAEREMDQIKKNTSKDTLKALKDAGLSELAQALEAGDSEKAKQLLNQGTEQANSAQSSQSTSSQLSKAAQSASDPSASQQLSDAAQALSSGNLQNALESLQNAALGQSNALAQASALSAMARSAAAQAGAKQAATLNLNGLSISGLASMSAAGNSAGSGSGSGSSSGMESGGGAGLGSTNKDGGYTASTNGTAPLGSNAPKMKVSEYESIYDPTRLGTEGEITNERGQIGEGEISEATIGSGLGSIDESVPYNEVLPEYYESAVEAVQNANLPGYAQNWVDRYFSSLTE
ncbi:MAG: hypothetical protein GX096_00925 [Clostridiales bacterium]|nr:hypothetical protein [Clostridiales bacterium]